MMLCIYISFVGFCRLFFFFFKQKTAYEMRISDWSSDVCSSDLLHSILTFSFFFHLILKTKNQSFLISFHLKKRSLIKLSLEKTQIGRASCRERVCQYV